MFTRDVCAFYDKRQGDNATMRGAMSPVNRSSAVYGKIPGDKKRGRKGNIGSFK